MEEFELKCYKNMWIFRKFKKRINLCFDRLLVMQSR